MDKLKNLSRLKTKFFYNKFLYYIMNNAVIVLGLISLVCFIYFFLYKKLYDFVSISDVGSISTAVTFVFFANNYCKDKKERSSRFHLEKVIKYFQQEPCLSADYYTNKNFLLSYPINIGWHRFITCLESTEVLRKKITEITDLKIYIIEYVDLAHKIIDLIVRVDSYKFFFGISDYSEKKDEDLYAEGDKNNTLISVEKLRFLMLFLHRANSLYNKKYEIYIENIDEKYCFYTSSIDGGLYDKMNKYIDVIDDIRCKKSFYS